MEIKQELRIATQLVMTPQLQQAIRLLQLSRLELQEFIQQELKENPLLEEVEEVREPVPSKENPSQEISWEEYVERFWGEPYPTARVIRDEEVHWEDFLTRPSTLTDHLLWQLRMTDLSPKEMMIGEEIIGNIDEDGYLRATVKEIAEEVDAQVPEVEKVLRLIQSFDPPGVGARDLRECLLIQLRQLPESSPLPRILLEEHFEQLKKRDYPALAKALGIPLEDVLKAVEVITGLEPKPGRPFGPEPPRIIIPDVFIYKREGEFEVVLNEDHLPHLRINPHYQKMLQQGGSGVPVDYLKEKMRSAQWLIKSLQQRQDTLYRVTKSIVKFQWEFLEKGIDYLRPLVLRDVAEDVGLHESTVSRVTTNKYAFTPQGLFELKFFFSGKIGEGPDEVSVRRVKKLIKEIISQEDPRKPYSDQKLSQILRVRYNIKVARRTVAKYREGLGIPSSSERRRPW